MTKKIVLLFIITAVVLLGGFCWSRFCSTGRYQVVFGTIQKEYSQVLTPEMSGEEHTKMETETKVIPVCVKFDSVTGRTWIYEYSYFVGADLSTHETNRFKEIP